MSSGNTYFIDLKYFYDLLLCNKHFYFIRFTILYSTFIIYSNAPLID